MYNDNSTIRTFLAVQSESKLKTPKLLLIISIKNYRHLAQKLPNPSRQLHFSQESVHQATAIISHSIILIKFEAISTTFETLQSEIETLSSIIEATEKAQAKH